MVPWWQPAVCRILGLGELASSSVLSKVIRKNHGRLSSRREWQKLFDVDGYVSKFGWSTSDWTYSHYFRINMIKSSETSSVLLNASKTFSVGICVEAFGPSSFKLSVMIVTTKLYKLTPLWITLAFIQGCKQNFCTNYFAMLSTDFDKRWFAFGICWSHKVDTHLVLID